MNREKTPVRYHYVDLLRGFAALAVLIAHYRWFYAQEVGDWRGDADLPLYSLLWPFYHYGNIPVLLFWALSGFVFVAAYGDRGRAIDWRTFAAHRVARLYPLHIATLLAICGLQAFSVALHGQPTVYGNFDIKHFVLHLFMASNWLTMDASYNGPIWSISVEVLAYFAFFAYMRCFGLKLIPAVLIATSSFAVFYVSHNVVASCFALFFAGVVIGILSPLLYRVAGRYVLAIAAAGLALAGAVTIALRGLSLDEYLPLIMGYIDTTVLLFAFIAVDLTARPLPRRFRWIGAITYSVYLLHMLVLISIKIIFPAPKNLDSPWLLLSFIGSVVVLAIFVHRYFELPAQRGIKKLLKG